MPRHIRKAAVVALAALLLGTQAVAALGGSGDGGSVTRSTIDPALHSERTLRALEGRVELADTALARARASIEALDGKIATLETEIRAASAARTADQRRLVRGTEAARERIVTWQPTQRPTLLELSEPLEVVAAALHSGDERRGALFAETGDLSARAARVQGVRAEIGAIAFELGGLREELATDAALATRSGWIGADAGRLLDRIRGLAGRVGLATTTLRQDEARILSLSIDLQEERDAIRDDIQGAREAEDALIAGLVYAEVTIRTLVASMLGDSPWGPFEDGVFEVCPVDMPNAYTDNWLAPRYGGGFHLHQGIDIFAAEGTPIRAPFPGTAVAAPNELGGLAVSVYGAEGYVYNAHLSEYGLLGEVETGDVIGYVGSTGNASGPHDHFEWHPGGGDAINPFEALNSACRPV
jgi:hypothetical protein